MSGLKTNAWRCMATSVTVLLIVAFLTNACSTAAVPSPTAAPAKPTVALAAAQPTAASAGAAQPTAVSIAVAKPTAASAAAAATQTLKIGVMVPLTGPAAASVGAEWSRGVEIAVDEINGQGGVTVGGQKYLIELKKYDDKYTAEGGAAAIQLAVYQDKVSFILGPPGAAPLLAAQPISEKENVLLFTAANVEEATTPGKPHTFKGMTGALEMAGALYDVLKQKFPDWKKIAILNPNDQTGPGETDRLSKKAEGIGWQVVAKDFFARDTNDFAPIMTKVMAQKPDVIDVAASPAQGLMVKHARELGFTGRMTGAGGDIMKVAGAAAEGFIGYSLTPDYFTDPSVTPIERSIAERYKAKYKDVITLFLVEQTYTCMKALVKAIETANSLDATKVAQTFRSDTFQWDTVVPSIKGRMTGEKTYGIRSITTNPFNVSEVKNGKVTVLAAAAVNVP